MIESCGVTALTVHGRQRAERPQHSNRNSEIGEIARSLSIPVIAKCLADLESFKMETECDSVMLARAAQNNPSIFRREGRLPIDSVIESYLKYAVEYNALPQNVKYVIQRMLGDEQTKTKRGQDLLASVTLRQMCKIWDLEEYSIKVRSRQRDRSHRSPAPPAPPVHALLSQPDILEMEISVPKKNFVQNSPKFVLSSWCRKERIKQPLYQTIQNEKKFRSVLSVDGRKYSSTCWERNKKFSEQAAAMVCLDRLGLRNLLSDDFWVEDLRPL